MFGQEHLQSLSGFGELILGQSQRANFEQSEPGALSRDVVGEIFFIGLDRSSRLVELLQDSSLERDRLSE